MLRPPIALLGGVALLGGCDLAPHYLRPIGAAPVTLPDGGAYPPAASDAPDVTRIGWRAFFLEPRLRQAIESGLANNRDLRVAAANVLEARAQLRVQRADLLPTIGATASTTYANSGGSSIGGGGLGTGTGGTGTGTSGTGSAGVTTVDYHYTTLGVAVSSFELDLFGRIRNLTRAAQEQVFASEAARRAMRISLIAEIATAWATMASDQEQLGLSRETLKTFAETLRLTTAQFQIGVGSELEVRQAEVNYQAARNDIATLETQVTRDQNALDLLVGTTVSADLLPTGLGDGAVTLDALPAGLSSEVLLRRPDVLEAEHLLIARNADIGAARAAFFPTISLTGAVGTISTGLSGLFAHGSFTYSASPSASLPLLDFGRNQGNLEYARAADQAAVATYEKTIQTAYREVADALAQRGTIGEQVDAQTARATAATTAARLSDARFRAGVDSFLTTLDAQRTAYAARQQLVMTRLTRVGNLVELYRALGGGLADDGAPGAERSTAAAAGAAR